MTRPQSSHFDMNNYMVWVKTKVRIFCDLSLGL